MTPHDDAPRLTAALAALERADPAARARALGALEAGLNLDDQSWQYDTMLTAITPLAAALPSLTGPERARLVGFLHHAAVMRGHPNGPDDAIHDGEWRDLRGDALFQAARAAAPAVAALLTDPGEAVRAAACAFLADVPPDDPAPLRRALDDAKPMVRGLAALALARWARFVGDATVLADVQCRARKGRGAEKTLAALAWVQLAPSPEAVDAALAALPKQSKETRPFPFASGNLFRFGLQVLALAPGEATSRGARLLAHIRGPMLALDGFETALACVEAFLGDSPPGLVACAPEDLSDTQRAFLAVLCEAEPWDRYYTDGLVSRGLPVCGNDDAERHDELRRYLGLAPAQGYTLRVPALPGRGEVAWPLYKWVRAVCAGVATQPALLEALVALPPGELLEAAICLCHPRHDFSITPGYEAHRFLELAVGALAARDGDVQPLLLDRIRRDLPAEHIGALAGALVVLARGLARAGRVLPEELDPHLPRMLPGWRPLARELAGTLPPARRDAFVELVGFHISAVGQAAAAVAGWDLADLHSQRARAAQLAVDALAAYEFEYHSDLDRATRQRRLAPKFRTKVLRALAALGDDGAAALAAALAGPPRPGIALLRDLDATLRRGPIPDATLGEASWEGARCRVPVTAANVPVRVDLRTSWSGASVAVECVAAEPGATAALEIADAHRATVATYRQNGWDLAVVALDAFDAVLDTRSLQAPAG